MKLNVEQMAVFSMLGATMYVSKAVMQFLPNIHLIGMFIIAFTAVFRAKALYPLYIYVMLDGIFSGFAMWWLPYLYVWTVLWAVAMPVTKFTPRKLKPIAYMLLCALHGLLFGVLYAPAQAIMFGLDFRATVTWIAMGFPFDLIHGISNFFCGLLICPIILVLRRAERYI